MRLRKYLYDNKIVISETEAYVKSLNKLLIFLKNQKEVLACCLIGSLARNEYVLGQSDIDILLLVSDTEIMKIIVAVNKRYLLGLRFENNIYSGYIGKNAISIAVRQYDKFLSHILKIMDAKYLISIFQPWVIGGEIPEVILSDIVSAIIFSDKKGELNRLQKILQAKFPENLATIGKLKLKKALNMKCIQAINCLETGKTFLGVLGMYEAVILLSRIYCIKNKKYHPGFKHIIKDKKFINTY